MDFKGTYKFKFLLPIFFLLQMTVCIFGQFYFPLIKNKIILGLIIYQYLKIISVIIKISYQVLHLVKASKKNYYPLTIEQNLYLFVIPNYNESIELLNSTLHNLSQHDMAKNKYIICLAMQNHEEGCQQKAFKIQQKFSNHFKYIFHTLHILQPGQSKGKASNVNWAVSHMQQILDNQKISSQNIILNIIDADAQLPQQYCQIIQQYLIEFPQRKHITYFLPPLIFCRNYKSVPFIVRSYDHLNSLFHFQQFNYGGKFAFPISNYSFSYKLAQRIDYWDTCADAIGQDYHTYLKAFWKFQSKLQIKLIYTPFNMMNVSGENYLDNIKAKFWQAQRHFQGCADLGYSIMMFYRTKKTLQGIIMLLYILQMWLFQTCIFATILGNFIYQLILTIYQNQVNSDIQYLLSHTFIFLLILLLSSFQIYRRIAIIYYFKGKVKLEGYLGGIFIIMELFISLFICIPIIACFSFLHAIFTSPFKQKQYIVSKKIFQKQKQIVLI